MDPLELAIEEFLRNNEIMSFWSTTRSRERSMGPNLHSNAREMNPP